MLCELTSGQQVRLLVQGFRSISSEESVCISLQQPMEYEEYLRKAQVVETTDSKAHRRVLPQTLIIHVDLPLVVRVSMQSD